MSGSSIVASLPPTRGELVHEVHPQPLRRRHDRRRILCRIAGVVPGFGKHHGASAQEQFDPLNQRTHTAARFQDRRGASGADTTQNGRVATLPPSFASDAAQSGRDVGRSATLPPIFASDAAQSGRDADRSTATAPTTVEVVRPERTIVRDVDEALPLILSGTALALALAGLAMTLVYVRIHAPRWPQLLSPLAHKQTARARSVRALRLSSSERSSAWSWATATPPSRNATTSSATTITMIATPSLRVTKHLARAHGNPIRAGNELSAAESNSAAP